MGPGYPTTAGANVYHPLNIGVDGAGFGAVQGLAQPGVNDMLGGYP